MKTMLSPYANDKLKSTMSITLDDDPFIVRRAFRDPSLLHDKRVLVELLLAEDRFLPSPHYFQYVQRDVRPWMRKEVAAWMLQVCEEQQCNEDVFPLALNYVDRFLSVVNIHRCKFQLVASVCMFLASKLKDSIPLTAEQLSIYTSHFICIDDILRWELKVLERLKWNLSTITPYDFIDYILNKLPLESNYKVIRDSVEEKVKACIVSDVKFSTYPPSVLTAAGIVAAVKMFHGKQASEKMKLLEKLQDITSIDSDWLSACEEQISLVVEKQTDTDMVSSSPHTPTDVRDINPV